MKRLSNNRKLILTILLGMLIGLFISFISIEQDTPCTKIGGKCYELEEAQTEDERRQGLSGRQLLAPDEGMLFVFDRPGRQCMWMKDMNFPLDIIWLDGRGRVISIEQGVAPDTYPDNFCSDADSLYVIELNAGEVADSGLRPGDFVVVN